jgi:hypothetical protein
MLKQNSSDNSARNDRKLAKALREARLLLECELDNEIGAFLLIETGAG